MPKKQAEYYTISKCTNVIKLLPTEGTKGHNAIAPCYSSSDSGLVCSSSRYGTWNKYYFWTRLIIILRLFHQGRRADINRLHHSAEQVLFRNPRIWGQLWRACTPPQGRCISVQASFLFCFWRLSGWLHNLVVGVYTWNCCPGMMHVWPVTKCTLLSI